MKIVTYLLTVLMFLIFSKTSFSEDEMGLSELLIKNLSNEDIKVIVYPIGVIFRNKWDNNDYQKYSPEADPDNRPNGREYITGGFKILTTLDNKLKINSDGQALDGECLFNVGYGLYKIDFYIDSLGYWKYVNYCYMDWRDSYYPYSYSYPPPANSMTNDVKIYFYSPIDIKFQFYGLSCGTDFLPIDSTNNHIKIWEQATRFNCSYNFFPQYGSFKSDSGYLNNWPINGSLYQNFEFVQIPHIGYGNLSLNLEIQNNHYPKINTGIPFVIEDSAKLTLKYSEVFENNARLYVQDSGRLFVRPTGELEIDKYGNVIISAVVGLSEQSERDQQHTETRL